MASDGRAAYRSPWAAALTALGDLVHPRRDIVSVGENVRLDGQHWVVTGAGRGLGRATAQALAERGAHLTIVSRQAPEELARRLSSVHRVSVRALGCEQSDLRQVVALADAVAEGAPLHGVVLNAGLMPRQTRITPQGYEEMFAVHFAANVVLVERWRAAGCLHFVGTNPPRIVVVASEAHRSSPPIDVASCELPPRFGVNDGMKWYGHSKLLLLAYFQWLARQASVDDPNGLAIHCLCPGPIASSIAREAPLWVRPLATAVMALCFKSPRRASAPVLYLAASPEVARTTGDYLHMMARKALDARALDVTLQDRLAVRARDLFAEFLL